MARTPLRRNELIRLLDAAAMPWYALDGERRVVYLNPSCSAWLGVDPNSLLGETANYHSEPAGRDASVAAGLAPPPEVFAGQRQRGVIARRVEVGPPVHREAEFMPLWRGSGEIEGVLVIVGVADLPPQESSSARGGEETSAELHRRLAQLRAGAMRTGGLARLVGESPAIRRVAEQVRLASASEGNVLVVGGKGSGAESIAQALAKARRGVDVETLVPLSSWLLDAELMQSTVVALSRRLEASPNRSGHTLLMYELDQLPPDAQVELAGLLPHLGPRLLIVATSTVPLLDLAREGKYHRELAHLASLFVIELPPLAERREDVPLLAQMFLEARNATGGKQRSGFTPEALDRLHAYGWPGDVDELGEVVRLACEKSTGTQVGANDLPELLAQAQRAAQFAPIVEEPVVLDELLADVERELLARAMRRAHGNKAKAAKLLSISRQRLIRRYKELGLE